MEEGISRDFCSYSGRHHHLDDLCIVLLSGRHPVSFEKEIIHFILDCADEGTVALFPIVAALPHLADNLLPYGESPKTIIFSR